MDAKCVTQAAKLLGVKPTPSPAGLPIKPVDVKSTLSGAGVAATPQQPSANPGCPKSTGLSVSSTPRSDRVRPLPKSTPKSTPKRQSQGAASRGLSFNGSPGGRSVSGPAVGWPMGPVPFRPAAVTARSPRGPLKPDLSEQQKRLGHKILPPVPNLHGGLTGGSPQPSQSALTAVHVPSAMQLLSAECQRRGFNPEWNFCETHVGRIVCHVRVGDTWVEGKTSHNDAHRAKISTAKEALKVVKQMPRRASGLYSFSGDTKPSAENRPLGENRPVVKHETGVGRALLPPRPNIRATPTVVKQEEDVVMRDSAADEPSRPISTPIPRAQTHAINQALTWVRGPQMDTRQGRTQGLQRTGGNARAGDGRSSTATELAIRTENISDDVLLAAQIRRSMAENLNPAVSKAFLDGLALGSRLGVALDRVPRSRHESRSRSPTARRRDDRHRVRSPQGSRIRLTPPPQYHNLPGRRTSDRYRPAGPASGEREVGAERGRENLVPRSAHTTPTEKRGADDEAWVHDLYFRHNRIKVEEED